MTSKTLGTTIGDALAAKGSDNWRADLRASGIDRRRPPSSHSGPDRGFIEQPAERIPTTTLPPRRRTEAPTLTAPVAIVRPQIAPPPEPSPKAEHETLRSRPEPEPEPEPEGAASPQNDVRLPPPPPPPVIEERRPPSRPPPPPKGYTMAKATRGVGRDGRKLYTEEYRVQVGSDYLERKAKDPALTLRGYADEVGVIPSLISRWAEKARAEAKRQERLAARRGAASSKPAPSLAASRTVSVQPLRVSNGARTFDVVTDELRTTMAELAELTERVGQLKRELRELLD
jgi:hypothetical protein